MVAALHAGAGDYLTWGRLGRLGVGGRPRAARSRRAAGGARTPSARTGGGGALPRPHRGDPGAHLHLLGRRRSAARVYVSPQIKAMTGYTPAEWLADREQLGAQHPPRGPRAGAGGARALQRATGGPFSCEYRMLDARGPHHLVARRRALPERRRRPPAVPARPHRRRHRAQAGGRDASSRLMYYDALTGLPNRALLLDRLQQELVAGTHQGRPRRAADPRLDRFRQVNNTLGHRERRPVIQRGGAPAGRRAGRRATSVARLRGDEFGCCCRAPTCAGAAGGGAHPEGARSSRSWCSGCRSRSAASIGIAVSPDHGDEAEALLRRADLGRAGAPSAAGESPVVYSPALRSLRPAPAGAAGRAAPRARERRAACCTTSPRST